MSVELFCAGLVVLLPRAKPFLAGAVTEPCSAEFVCADVVVMVPGAEHFLAGLSTMPLAAGLFCGNLVLTAPVAALGAALLGFVAPWALPLLEGVLP